MTTITKKDNIAILMANFGEGIKIIGFVNLWNSCKVYQEFRRWKVYNTYEDAVAETEAKYLIINNQFDWFLNRIGN